MTDNGNKTDWADKLHKRMLVDQRKYLWTDDSIEKLAGWFDMKPGMTMVDVGCGLGYLGYTFWKFMTPDGRYIGIDESEKLLFDAADAAKDWSENGRVEFNRGDAYNLPLADNSCDIAACQTLMMHLVHPDKALNEMIRVIKPAGRVVCFEPDNVAALIYPNYWSVKEYSLDEYLLCVKVVFTCYEGAKKLGQGDRRIGIKMPRMMYKSGLVNVDI